jgi:hypothetical protein
MLEEYLECVIRIDSVKVLSSDCTDDYKNMFKAGTCTVQGHYLEFIPRQQRQYYLDETKNVIIPTYTVASIIKDTFISTVKVVKEVERKCITLTESQHEIYLNLVMDS